MIASKTRNSLLNFVLAVSKPLSGYQNYVSPGKSRNATPSSDIHAGKHIYLSVAFICLFVVLRYFKLVIYLRMNCLALFVFISSEQNGAVLAWLREAVFNQMGPRLAKVFVAGP